MIQAEEILQLLRKRPFQPFRVVLKDGKHYDILFHENNLVFRSCIDIGIPVAGMEDPVADHFETVMLDQIDRLELLQMSVGPTL
jgi:hypothetical protein